MTAPLHILILEDSSTDAELMAHELDRAGFNLTWERVETETEYLAALDSMPDLILADYSLPKYDARRALQSLQERGLDIPFIVITGSINEEVAVDTMKRGATDYLLKDRPARLGAAVASALEQKQLREQNWRADQALRESEERFRALVERSQDAIALANPDGTILYASPSAARIVGVKPEAMIGRSTFERIHPDDVQRAKQIFNHVAQNPGSTATQQFRIQHRDGSWHWIEGVGRNMLHVPSVRAMVANYRDITERKRAEEERQHHIEQLTILNAAAIKLQQCLDPQEIIRVACSELQRFGNFASIYWLTADGKYLEHFHTAMSEAMLQEYVQVFGDNGLQLTVPIELLSPVWRQLESGEAVFDPEIVPKVIATLPSQSRPFTDWIVAHSAQSAMLLAPLKRDGAVIGLLSVLGDQWGASDLSSITLFARHVSVALENARLFDDVKHRAQQLTTINAAGHTLAETLELNVIYERLARTTLDLLPDISTVYISLYDPERELLTAVYGIHENQVLDVSGFPPIPLEARNVGTQSETIHTRRPVIINDLRARLAQVKTKFDVGESDQANAPGPWTLSGLYVPMLAKDKVIGVIQVQSYTLNRFTPVDAELLEFIATTAAVAIENARLFDERRRRLIELEAINRISIAMRHAQTIAEMVPILLQETLAVLKATTTTLWLYDSARGILVQVGELNFPHIPGSLAPHQGIAGQVFSSGQTYLSAEFKSDPLTVAENRDEIPAGLGGACVPILALEQVIGVLFVSVFLPRQLTPDEIHLLTTIAEIAGNAIHRTRLHQQTEQDALALTLAYDKTIEGWSHALDQRDKETEGHTQRVTEMTLRLARAMHILKAELIHIRRGALLHDIGKMGVPDAILLKPGALDAYEWKIMRRHPELAYELLAPIAFLHPALNIPYCHHEKWDGTGYPRGLKGDQIPLAARIFSVVDVWDALRSDRPYRPAWSSTETRNYIQAQSGVYFDPQIAEKFLALTANTDS
ncbi:MAG: GAF domain-containing protein [Chloroflexi bacterium]|nr:GAF domain-containing protein [Chloroflexota bacterium]